MLLPLAFCRLPCAFCLVPFALCPLPCAVCLVPFALCLVPFAVCLVPFALCLLPFAVCLVPLCTSLTLLLSTNSQNTTPPLVTIWATFFPLHGQKNSHYRTIFASFGKIGTEKLNLDSKPENFATEFLKFFHFPHQVAEIVRLNYLGVLEYCSNGYGAFDPLLTSFKHLILRVTRILYIYKCSELHTFFS